MAYPKNFDPALLVGMDGSYPFPEQEPWYSWCNGENTAISSEFALFLWWQLANAMDSMVMKSGRERPEKYKAGGDGEHTEGQIQIFRAEFNERFELVDEIIRANWFPCQPYAYEGEIEDATKGGYSEVELMAAYGIRCMDEGITATFNKDSIISSQCFCYAMEAIHLAWEYRNVGGDPIRIVAKAGARARHAKDPKQTALGKVRKHWAEWQTDPTLYGSKAAFARDMCDAYPVLTSVKVIEDKCRAWEKTRIENRNSTELNRHG